MITAKQYLVIFLIAILSGILTAVSQIPFWMTAVLLAVTVTLIIYLPFAWYMYFSADMEKVETYLKKRKKLPLFQFYWSLANKKDDELESALSSLHERNKAPHLQAVFTVTYAAYKEALAFEKDSILQIRQLPIRKYYEALLKIEAEKWNEAEEKGASLPKEWMRESVTAELLHRKGLYDQAVPFEKRAINHTRGVQRYLLFKKYRGGH